MQTQTKKKKLEVKYDLETIKALEKVLDVMPKNTVGRDGVIAQLNLLRKGYIQLTYRYFEKIAKIDKTKFRVIEVVPFTEGRQFGYGREGYLVKLGFV